jgi:acetyl/propionyl-CoA carboxylase alpha subunit
MLGYPLMIKDPHSGGGKAMRRVMTEADFSPAWDAVLAEGRRLTTSTTLLIERYIEQGRHVEVQVAGDGQSFIHLFERECSIQRRHQKIIEEAPCLFVNTPTLERMYQAALTAARAVGYNSIGTVEFMVTPEGDFHFLEMNTRLQVEHGVTEMTTGIDLVLLQLDIAQTGTLPLQQAAVTRRGHAIECRLYAEDPTQRFTPSTGVLRHLTLPTGPFLRVEHDLRQGQEVTQFFDPMIAKLVAFGADRQTSLNNMAAALATTRVEGIKTNRLFLLALLRDTALVTGAFHTQSLVDMAFMERLLDTAQPSLAVDAQLALLAGLAVALVEQEWQSPSRSDGLSQTNLAQGASRRRWRDQLSWR